MSNYKQHRTISLSPEEMKEWLKNLPSTQSSDDNFNNIQFPIVRQVSATTIGGGGWVKSKKQQLKEDRINKLRKIKGKKPNVKLEKDEWQDGLISVKPLSAPSPNLFYMDFTYSGNTNKNI
jgi:hypothetical protein